jgi:ferrous iron transport protein B
MNSLKAALIGNPNSGKSTLFNQLTGMRQKTSNFPGVTVDKKIGSFNTEKTSVELIDLPGTYSLFPNSTDEKIIASVLTNEKSEDYPDLIIYVADVNSLERHMLLATQILDLKIPILVVLNMIDVFESKGNELNLDPLAKYLQVPIVVCDARTGKGLDEIKKHLDNVSLNKYIYIRKENIYHLTDAELQTAEQIKNLLHVENNYAAKLIGHHHTWLNFLKVADIIQIKSYIGENNFENIKLQINETMSRYAKMQFALKDVVKTPQTTQQNLTLKLDGIITHKILGPLIFFSLMFIIFQAIFSVAEYPMTWIENSFVYVGDVAKKMLPQAWYTDLLINGLWAGLSGVLVFIPQIAILFFFLAILEESGYMSRVVYMFDNIMQRVGLNGRSMVALISSGACAIPAIMSTRTIGNWKERLITIMVAPLIPCSARIPVYTVLIALMIPGSTKIGIFNAQGTAFMALYLLGIFTSLVVALVLKFAIKSEDKSFLMLELPQYKKPMWKNVFLEVYDKVKSFVASAGKIILIISVVLWSLASFGPSGAMERAENEAQATIISQQLDDVQADAHLQSKKLEASYAGILGKFIEPTIKPLGFDWKIGIALLTSFAAREVFVGTMATIYNVNSDAEESTVRERMAKEYRSGTDKPLYDFATCMSLLLFYAFAMQCMSTLAVTKKETQSWKWAVIQFLFMTILAYLSSFAVYQFLK